MGFLPLPPLPRETRPKDLFLAAAFSYTADAFQPVGKATAAIVAAATFFFVARWRRGGRRKCISPLVS